MDYTAGKGTTALSIIGTTLGALAVAGGAALKSIGANAGNGNCAGNYSNGGNGCCSEDRVVNRYEAAQAARIAELETQVALRDSNTYTDQKILATYQYIDGELKDIRSALCAQAVHNQKTEDSFALARQDIAAVKTELCNAIAMEAERRCCADNSIVNYVNATFYPKMVADVEIGTTSAAQTLFNPIPKCGCCNGN